MAQPRSAGHLFSHVLRSGATPGFGERSNLRRIRRCCAQDPEWKIIAAILMPDHVHVLAAPSNRDARVGEISAGLKRAVRRRVQASWQWQTGCFDRLLRSDESAEEKWNYIRENPVRARLVEHWSHWPYRIGFEL